MKQVVNNDVEIEVPAGFTVLSDEEAIAWAGKFAKDSLVMRNVDKHVAIVVSYRKTNFLNKNMSLEKVLAASKNSIKTIKPTVKFLDEINTTIDGKETIGFKYSETIKGINQNVIYLLVKNNDFHYSFNYLGRLETFDEYYSVFKETLESVRFIK